MKKKIIYVLVFGILGLLIGYGLFGKIAGEYVNIRTIFGVSQNAFESFGRNVSGLTGMKQNILISGGIGAIIGLLISVLKKK